MVTQENHNGYRPRKVNPLRQRFGHLFAGSAFGFVSGDAAIVGKFGSIVPTDGGSFDCWIVGPDRAPLTERKLTAIEKRIESRWTWRRLTGEAVIGFDDAADLPLVAELVGVRRKKRHPGNAANLRAAKVEAAA